MKVKLSFRTMFTIGSLGLFGASNAHAFVGRECSVVFDDVGAPLSIAASLLALSSQHSTSYGPCSAQKKPDKRRAFYIVNANAVRTNAARGFGEDISVLALLSGCEKMEARLFFNAAAKKNYEHVFKNVSVDESLVRIDAMVQADPDLSQRCVLSPEDE